MPYSRRCFVAGCHSGYELKTRKNKELGIRNESLFKAKNNAQIRKWREMIPPRNRVFSSVDAVCELHFSEDDIIKFFETKMPDGRINRIERERYMLKDGAFPTIFSDLPMKCSKVIKHRNSPEERNLVIPSKIRRHPITENEYHEDCEDVCDDGSEELDMLAESATALPLDIEEMKHEAPDFSPSEMEEPNDEAPDFASSEIDIIKHEAPDFMPLEMEESNHEAPAVTSFEMEEPNHEDPALTPLAVEEPNREAPFLISLAAEEPNYLAPVFNLCFIKDSLKRIELPGPNWSATVIDDNVVFLFVGRTFITEKTLVVSEDLAIKVLFYGKQAAIDGTLTSMDDLLNTIKVVHNLQVCAGMSQPLTDGESTNADCMGYLVKSASIRNQGRHGVWCESCKLARKRLADRNRHRVDPNHKIARDKAVRLALKTCRIKVSRLQEKNERLKMELDMIKELCSENQYKF